MGFELAPDYKDVPTRIADFKQRHPDGCLRPVNPEQPYEVVTIGQQFFIVYAAAAYRSPDDQLPGIGVAWEPFPGRTPYTKDSELQNAETSAWGRAIVAALRSESRAVASAEDVRNRQADAVASQAEIDELREAVKDAAAALTDDRWNQVAAWAKKLKLPSFERLTVTQAQESLAFIASLTGDTPEPDPTKIPAPPDVVAEYEHEANQLGGDQVAALAVWLTREHINPTGMTRAQALAAIGKARELRSATGPIDTEAEPDNEEAEQ